MGGDIFTFGFCGGLAGGEKKVGKQSRMRKLTSLAALLQKIGVRFRAIGCWTVSAGGSDKTDISGAWTGRCPATIRDGLTTIGGVHLKITLRLAQFLPINPWSVGMGVGGGKARGLNEEIELRKTQGKERTMSGFGADGLFQQPPTP